MRGLCGLAVATAILAFAPAATRSQVMDPFNDQGIIGMAKAGNYLAVEARLNAGDSPNTLGGNGATPLILVSQSGHCDVARLLLSWHARTDIKDSMGNTALMYAAEFGHVACLEDLIAAHADVNATSREGSTALMRAARSGKLDAVRALIGAKADVSMTDFTGATALSYAQAARQRQIVQLLEAAGAR